MPNNIVSSGSISDRGCRMSTQGRVTFFVGAPVSGPGGKDVDEGSGNCQAETCETSRRRRQNDGNERERERERSLVARGDDLARIARGLSRRSNLNGPFDTELRRVGEGDRRGSGWDEFNRINRIQLKAPSNARLDSAAS